MTYGRTARRPTGSYKDRVLSDIAPQVSRLLDHSSGERILSSDTRDRHVQGGSDTTYGLLTAGARSLSAGGGFKRFRVHVFRPDKDSVAASIVGTKHCIR